MNIFKLLQGEKLDYDQIKEDNMGEKLDYDQIKEENVTRN